MLVVLRPEAEQELLDAQAWYESKALGLGVGGWGLGVGGWALSLPVPLMRQ